MTRSRSTLPALLVALALALASPSAALGATSADLQKHQRAAEDAKKAAKVAEQNAARLLEETREIDERIDGIEADLAGLRPKITKTSSRRARLEAEVQRLRGDIVVKEKEIESTHAELTRQQGLLAERVAAAYKQGDFFYFELVLTARDLTDLLTRASYVQRAIADNQELAADLARTKGDLETARNDLDRSLQAVNAKRVQVAAEERTLRALHAEERGKLTDQRSAHTEKSRLVAENQANAARLRAQAEAEERESARIAAELRNASGGAGVYNGVMAWPVPGSHRVTSNFGWRVHPVLGYRRMHTGIDIGAGSGSIIVAAGDGTVIYAAYRGGYGNTIMIDHGDGVVSLYAHQSRLIAGNGQRVSKGQTIGRVGSTGLSTGPHLHFEVRVNGSPVDPMRYLR